MAGMAAAGGEVLQEIKYEKGPHRSHRLPRVKCVQSNKKFCFIG